MLGEVGIDRRLQFGETHTVAHDTRVGGVIQECRVGFYQVVKVGVVTHVIFSQNIAVADAGIPRIVLRQKLGLEVMQSFAYLADLAGVQHVLDD